MLKFTTRKNGRKMATIRIPRNVGLTEIVDAVAYSAWRNSRLTGLQFPKSRQAVEKLVRYHYEYGYDNDMDEFDQHEETYGYLQDLELDKEKISNHIRNLFPELEGEKA